MEGKRAAASSVAFGLGGRRRTPFQVSPEVFKLLRALAPAAEQLYAISLQAHKELEAEKKRKEDEAAARVYSEFVQSFEDAGPATPQGPKAFVRGEVIQPGQAASSAGSSGRTGKYVPKFMPPGMAAAFSGQPTVKQEDPAPAVAPSPAASKTSRQRNIDLVLENLKKEQERREERQRLRDAGVEVEGMPDDTFGSFDDGDPFTTNLYIGNLAPDVDEEVLKKEFGRFGPLASVKIMWPRDEDQRARRRNCGFVAFMNRNTAQHAKDTLNGVILHENELHIGWGKGVPIPANPMFVLGPAMAGQPSAVRGAEFAPPGAHLGPTAASRATGWGGQPEAFSEPPRMEAPGEPDVEVQVPADQRVRYIADTLASYVLRDGTDFEQAVMAREHANPEFAFLFDLISKDHTYYRWRLFSLANDDGLRAWRPEPFQLVEGAARWIPPAMTAQAVAKTAAQRGGELHKDKPLPDVQRDRFEDLLRALTLEREAICNAMVFALDHAECASEVVEVLTDALTLDETPVPTKVARLFLVSDILYNSTAAVRNASRYRVHMETALPDIFESFQEAYLRCDSRITQEGLRRHVLRVLRMWRNWSIFTDDFLNGLQATFLRGASALAGGKASSPQLDAELQQLSDEDLATRCRRSGLSRKGDRAAQVQRLLELHSYLNGGSQQEQQRADSNALHAAAWRQQQDALAQALVPTGDNKPVLGAIAEDAVPAPETADAAEAATEPEPAAVQPAAQQTSAWAEVADTDEPVGPISEWLAAAPPPDNPAPDERAGAAGAGAAGAAPTSKWSLVDYDDDEEPSAAAAGDQHALEPAAMDMSPAGTAVEDAAATGRPGADVQAAAQANGAAEAPSEQPTARDLRHTKDDEKRRQRLRQIEVEVMMYREQLERDQPELAREAVEARAAAHRAQLQQQAEAVAGQHAGAEPARKRAAEKPAKPSREDADRASKRDRSSRDESRRRSASRDRSAAARRSSRSPGGRSGRSQTRGERDERRQSDRPGERDREKAKDRGRDRSRSDRAETSELRRSASERSSARDRDRERERERDMDKDRERQRGREKDRDRSDRSQRDRDRDRHRERDSSRERVRKRARSRSRSASASRRRRRSRSRSADKRSSRR